MNTLAEQIEEAQARLLHLQRQAAGATCDQVGHAWSRVGGANCGCHLDATCSVPVHVCKRCGECDYGHNVEAEDRRAACAEDWR
jgi:hypothetical protein